MWKSGEKKTVPYINIEDKWEKYGETNYTYAYSGSYDEKLLGQEWISPNLSRPRLREISSSTSVVKKLYYDENLSSPSIHSPKYNVLSRSISNTSASSISNASNSDHIFLSNRKSYSTATAASTVIEENYLTRRTSDKSVKRVLRSEVNSTPYQSVKKNVLCQTYLDEESEIYDNSFNDKQLSRGLASTQALNQNRSSSRRMLSILIFIMHCLSVTTSTVIVRPILTIFNHTGLTTISKSIFKTFCLLSDITGTSKIARSVMSISVIFTKIVRKVVSQSIKSLFYYTGITYVHKSVSKTVTSFAVSILRTLHRFIQHVSSFTGISYIYRSIFGTVTTFTSSLLKALKRILHRVFNYTGISYIYRSIKCTVTTFTSSLLKALKRICHCVFIDYIGHSLGYISSSFIVYDAALLSILNRWRKLLLLLLFLLPIFIAIFLVLRDCGNFLISQSPFMISTSQCSSPPNSDLTPFLMTFKQETEDTSKVHHENYDKLNALLEQMKISQNAMTREIDNILFLMNGETKQNEGMVSKINSLNTKYINMMKQIDENSEAVVMNENNMKNFNETLYNEVHSLLNTNINNENEFTSKLNVASAKLKNVELELKGCCNKSFFYDSLMKEVERLIRLHLHLYDADKTSLPDYALDSAGGTILSTRCTITYSTKKTQWTILGWPIWSTYSNPTAAINPNMNPGNCWAFHGQKGYLVIALSDFINPTGFTLEHIHKSNSPDGNITSAPREFHVLGLDEVDDHEGFLLGEYEFHHDQDPLQFFKIQNPSPHPFKIVELRILSNNGHPEYTCLYRFRVHGSKK